MALLSAIRRCHFWQHVQIRSNGVTDATYYRWRQEYSGLKVNQAKRLKDWRRRLPVWRISAIRVRTQS